MLLKNFIAETISQIKDGIDKANEEAGTNSLYPDYIEFDMNICEADEPGIYVASTESGTKLRFVVGVNQS